MSQSDNSRMKEEPLAFPLKKEESAFLYDTPKNYFLDFPEVMLQDIQAMEADEIKLNLSQDHPYNIEPDYFIEFPNQVLDLIKIEETNSAYFINQLPKQSPFHIPENFYASFETELFQKMNIQYQEQEDDLVELSPLLAGLKYKQVFEVPEGYFSQPQQKTIAFKPRTAQQSIKWMRWAAAAMVIAIFSLGGARFLNNSIVNPTNNYASVKQEISKISDAEIKEYLNATLNDYEVTMLAQNIDWNNNGLDDISNEELKNYLDDGAY